MTKSQGTLYWREWGNLTKRCKKENWPAPDRHDLHVRALGADKSHNDFSNSDFDKVLGVFRSYSHHGTTGELNVQVRQERMPRTRLEHAIVNERAAMLAVLLAFERGVEIATPAEIQLDDHGFAEQYITTLMDQRFSTTDITQISNEPRPDRTGEKSDMECLRDTLDARITVLRRKTPLTWHALRMRAGVPCDCATFCGGSRREKNQ